MTEPPPIVFISYSWDSEDHKTWVLELATKLVNSGVDVRLDQWHTRLGDSFTHFMESAIETADRVLMILTPAYARKANEREGGVGYEQQIISSEVFDGARGKFVPLLRQGSFQPGRDLALPTHLRGVVGIDMRPVANFDCAFEQLVREIHGKQLSAPSIGPVPTFKEVSTIAGTDLLAQGINASESAEDHGTGGWGTIRLLRDLAPAGGRSAIEMACDEILTRRRNGDKVVMPSVFVEEQTPLRRLLESLEAIDTPTAEQRRARFELKKQVAHTSAWGVPLDILLQEVTSIALTHLGPGSTPWVYNTAHLAEVLEVTYGHFSSEWNSDSGTTKIDIYRRDPDANYGIWLSEAEVDNVLTSAGYGQKKYMMLGIGFEDLPTDVIRSKLLPAQVFEYMRLKYGDSSPLPAGGFFAQEGWTLSLG